LKGGRHSIVAPLKRFPPFAILVLVGMVFAFNCCGAAGAASASPPTAASTPAQPARYLGEKVCKSCQQAAAHSFSQTMMGKIMLAHPRDEAEKHGCESCHGPGSRYVPGMAQALGRGEKADQAMHGAGVGGVITFVAIRENRPLSRTRSA
jgi:cytochrome c peroxidase